jgi:hypothetical protein
VKTVAVRIYVWERRELEASRSSKPTAGQEQVRMSVGSNATQKDLQALHGAPKQAPQDGETPIGRVGF